MPRPQPPTQPRRHARPPTGTLSGMFGKPVVLTMTRVCGNEPEYEVCAIEWSESSGSGDPAALRRMQRSRVHFSEHCFVHYLSTLGEQCPPHLAVAFHANLSGTEYGLLPASTHSIRWCAEHGVPALVTSSNRGDHGQIMHALNMQPPQLNFRFHGSNPWASQSQGIDKNYSNILTAANSYWVGVRGFA
ncbi:MAG: hypothetical protein WDW38_006178 [Sanguina aurantia]